MGRTGLALETQDSRSPHPAASVFAVNRTPSAFITANVVFSVGFPFSLNDR